jgi:hypothetical protein
MSASVVTGEELIPYTFATWVFLLHVDGVVAADEAVAGACAQVLAAEEEEQGNAAGEALVERVKALIGDASPTSIAAAAGKLYGARASGTLGQGPRQERTARIRKYQFEHQLPWLARIWERTEAGEVAPSWLLVERVTDVVRAADPNPWNDIDEARVVPIDDFQVLWELDGCTSVHLA